MTSRTLGRPVCGSLLTVPGDTAGASEFKMWLVDSDGVGVASNLDDHTAAGAIRSLIRGYHLDYLSIDRECTETQGGLPAVLGLTSNV